MERRQAKQMDPLQPIHLRPAGPRPATAPPAARRPLAPGQFVLGANLPWLQYGGDFGANAWNPKGGVAQPERAAELEGAMAQLQAKGVTHLRWWLLGDGRNGVRFARDGTPLGLEPHLFDDMDAALAAATRHGITITFALTDFGWVQKGNGMGAVPAGDHGDTLKDPGKRHALVDRVLTPIFQRYGQHPAIEAWDLFNEPEWVTRGWWTLPWKGVSRKQMHSYLEDAATAAHTYASQPVTVGLANAKGLSLVRDLGLDFYQVHWYDYQERFVPLAQSLAKLKLDAPLVLGEYPSQASNKSVGQILDTAKRSGYAGAYAWSVYAHDKFTGGPGVLGAIAAWGKRQLGR
ncbi:MAG: Endo-beta-mannanase [Cyanobacteria bacterium RYN_339]|nr:Endo-beta-mannanase [Cyanobacteria bacterium RYN_339]